MPARKSPPAARTTSRTKAKATSKAAPKAATKKVAKTKAAPKAKAKPPATTRAKAGTSKSAGRSAPPAAPPAALRLVTSKHKPVAPPVVRPANLSAGDARSKDVMEIDWTLFGELSRALALKVARAYDPDLVIGIATAGVIPGATIAAILDREFHSMIISRRYHSETVRATPAVFGQVPSEVRDQHVLIVDETCDSGATMRLAVAALLNAGAADVRTAVSFRTGSYATWSPPGRLG